MRAAVERSAAPAEVSTAVARLADARPDAMARLTDDRQLLEAVVAVTAASRSLTDLCLTDAAALDVLSRLDDDVPSAGLDRDTRALARWKRLALLRVAARDLLGLDDLVVVGRHLATIATTVLRAAYTLAAADAELAVIGMGKLGGAELNYASDVDVLFVGGGDPTTQEAAARRIMEVARTCFRVDADLRPEGRSGPLVRTLESYETYWERWAQTWEFQALLKAQPVAGDAVLGRAFHGASQRRIWLRPFTPDDVRAVRAMKARAEAELTRRGLADREVKRGRGGIRDIEFAVQLLQLVHGQADSMLRSANTLDALSELAAGGYVGREDAVVLDEAYRFLRAVEHRLQLVAEQQVHAVPTERAARGRLARVMGYRDMPARTASAAFEGDLRRHQATVRSVHERVFFRPLLEALAGRADALAPTAIETRLIAFGFTDAERTRRAVTELTRGLTRPSRLMKQLLPLLLEWLSESPDPDLGLLGLRRLASGPGQATDLTTAFRESPEAARRLCLLLGTSRLLADDLLHNPDLIPALAGPEGLAVASDHDGGASLRDAAADAISWRKDNADQRASLRRLKHREELRIAARDVLSLDGGEEVVMAGRRLTTLAEVAVEAALRAVAPAMPFAVVGMGRFGGAELSYASDLDLLFVYDGSTAADFAAAEGSAETLLRFLGGEHGPARIYATDLDLRPEGRQGPLARSLDGYRRYYESYARTWERQALVRARPVAGDSELAARFLGIVEAFVWGRGVTDDEVREIRRMKARIERERIPPKEDPRFHLKLGRGSLSDVEFTAQLLQLQHRVQAPGTMAALDALGAAGVLEAEDRAALAGAYRFCERTRNRWYLVRGVPGDALPSQPEQLGRLARSLDVAPVELREQYRRVTRRARDVVQRVFYGVQRQPHTG